MITAGSTLRVRGEGHGSPEDLGVEDTRRILQEVKESSNSAVIEELKQKAKPTKRCLSKEVDKLCREKMGLEPTGKRKKDSEEKPSKSKKSKISTPKGQKKMTSFFSK